MKLDDLFTVNTSELHIGVYKGKEFVEEFSDNDKKKHFYRNALVTDIH